jgi:hypothetical protein
MATHRPSRAELVARLRRTRLVPVASRAVRKLGYADDLRMAAVQYAEADVIYGYPNLTDGEVEGLLDVMKNRASIGEYVNKVIKANHDPERVRSDENPE